MKVLSAMLTLLFAGLAGIVAPCTAQAALPTAAFSKPVIDLGMVVTDADRTARFLTNAIGFKEVQGFAVTAELGRKVGLIDGHATQVRVFVLGDGDLATRLKVLCFPKATGKAADTTYIHSTPGFRYLTLYVQDLGPALERLKAEKITLLGDTPLDLGGGTWIAVVRDPDGNFFELIGPRP